MGGGKIAVANGGDHARFQWLWMGAVLDAAGEQKHNQKRNASYGGQNSPWLTTSAHNIRPPFAHPRLNCASVSRRDSGRTRISPNRISPKPSSRTTWPPTVAFGCLV